MGLKDKFKKPQKKRLPKKAPTLPTGDAACWLHGEFDSIARDCYGKRLGVDVIYMRCRYAPDGKPIPFGCPYTSLKKAMTHRPNYDDMVVIAMSRDASDLRAKWDRKDEKWITVSSQR